MILDLLCEDAEWAQWSDDALVACAGHARLVIDAIIFAEVSMGYRTMDGVDLPLSSDLFVREPLPWAAAFRAGKAYEQYRRRGGIKRLPLPDFYIGAHAEVTGMRLLTRDAPRYRTNFPTVEIIAPNLP